VTTKEPEDFCHHTEAISIVIVIKLLTPKNPPQITARNMWEKVKGTDIE
jgi:hypothetical protein